MLGRPAFTLFDASVKIIAKLGDFVGDGYREGPAPRTDSNNEADLVAPAKQGSVIEGAE
jgi:hypothetical protein